MPAGAGRRVAGALISLVLVPWNVNAAVSVTRADIQTTPGSARVVLESSAPLRFRLLSLRRRVILELDDAEADPAIRTLVAAGAPGNRHIGNLRLLRARPGSVRLEIELKTDTEPHISSQAIAGGYRLTLEMAPGAAVLPPLEELFAEV